MGGGPVGNDGALPILVPTILKIAEDAVAYWTNMTCLYDPYWSETEHITLPVCMFHMTGMTETWSNETSRKRVILYEEPQTMLEMANPMRRGVMETAVDNTVKNPKTYDIEAIVPFLPIGRYVSSGVRGITDTIATIVELAANGDSDTRDDLIAVVEGVMAVAGGILGAATALASIANRFGGNGSAMTMNKNSLEAMADSGRVLCLKTWNGYDYKYVVITGLTVQKRPLEDEVFRAKLQLQELPVLSVTEPTDLQAKSPQRTIPERFVKGVYGALARPLIGITGVRSADAGGPLGGNAAGEAASEGALDGS